MKIVGRSEEKAPFIKGGGVFGESRQVQMNFRTSPEIRDFLIDTAEKLGKSVNGTIEAAVISFVGRFP